MTHIHSQRGNIKTHVKLGSLNSSSNSLVMYVKNQHLIIFACLLVAGHTFNDSNSKILEQNYLFKHLSRETTVPELKRQGPADYHNSFDSVVEGYIHMSLDPNIKLVINVHQNYNPLNNPFRTIVGRMVSVNGYEIAIPLYLKATITHNHVVRSGPRPPIPSSSPEYTSLLGHHLLQNPYLNDEIGHLLALSLGGPTYNLMNFVPQTSCFNKNIRGHASAWLKEEEDMRRFLAQASGRRIEWELVVNYHSPNYQGIDLYRPVSFNLRHRNYNENNQLVDNVNNPITDPLPIMSFSNNPADLCSFELLT